MVNKKLILIIGLITLLFAISACGVIPPDVPEIPDDIQVPNDTEVPDEEDVPEVPDEEDVPEVPDEPEIPDEPGEPEEPNPDEPEEQVDDFNLFVDTDSLNGDCSDSYSKEQNSLSTPFCSIQRAADLVEPGDRVRVERGFYEEYVNINRSGTSDEPIVFSGVRGRDGEWLTVIRGGNLVSNWDLAPEIDLEGYGVYKTNLGFRPYAMMVNNRALMHLKPENNNYLSVSPTHIRSSDFERVIFWDGIEAIYGYNTSTKETYIRFRDGDNPNNMNIYATPSNSGILINNAANIIVRDFEITNMRQGIMVTGSQAKDVIIENNKLINSETRIRVTENAQRVHIRNNMIQMRWLLDEFFQGPWINSYTDHDYDEPVVYQMEVRYHLYLTPKRLMFRGYGIHIASGSEHEVYENNILDSYFAIGIHSGTDIKIYDNFIKNASSIGVVNYAGTMNLQVFNNEFHDVNIPLRFQDLYGKKPRSIYFFNNKMSSSIKAGMGTFFHEGPCIYTIYNNITAWIYHNSYSGYTIGIRAGCTNREDEGIPGLYVVNNVISTRHSLSFNGDWLKENMIGAVDYNWFMNNPTNASWLGDNNIILESGPRSYWKDFNSWMWDIGDRSFILPANSTARNSGLDLSKPFVLNGVTHEPLPGMNPGYFSGDAPNMGAIQD
jgi:hypothetical protein